MLFLLMSAIGGAALAGEAANKGIKGEEEILYG